MRSSLCVCVVYFLTQSSQWADFSTAAALASTVIIEYVCVIVLCTS